MTASTADFLQSVVMFDDRAYLGDTLLMTGPAANEDEFELYSGADGTAGESAVSTSADEPLEHDDFDTQAVVNGFADRGMTCAVLAPTSGDARGDTARFLSLSRRADVVILDWLIGQGAANAPSSERPASQNRTSAQLILEVLKHDNRIGSRLRFMCVYSGVSDIQAAQESLSDSIEREISSDVLSQPGRIDVGNARIVFLSKEGAALAPPASTLSADELPDRVIQEFTDFAMNGLMPGIAINSLTAVRDQAHRVLRRFRAELDPALLAHRAATSPEAAQEFMVNLVADELGAIVSRGFSSNILGDQEVNSHLSRLFDGQSSSYVWKGGRGANVPALKLPVTVAEQILQRGLMPDHSFAVDSGNTLKFSRATSLTSLAMIGDSAEVRSRSMEVDLAFSKLSALSRDASVEGEDAIPPELRLGTLLCLPAVPRSHPRGSRRRLSDEDRFFICLQPICDSTRVFSRSVFPLHPLVEEKHQSDSFAFAVSLGTTRVLSHKLKLGKLKTPTFDPDLRSGTVRAEWSDGQWYFKGGRDRYVWLGDVRLDKAHRLAHMLATDSGRVGINEYEYLRRRHD